MSADLLNDLLNQFSGRYYRRKRWLYDIASLKALLTALPTGPVVEIVTASVDFADWWASADFGDEGLEERQQLIRAYDRRQLRKPLLQRIDGVRASEFPGTPTTRRQLEFHALQAATGLLNDTHEWGMNPDFALRSAWA